MFDNLRQQSQQPEDQVSAAGSSADRAFQASQTSSGAPPLLQAVLNLTPMQRFVLALMLFLNVTVLGCFALLAFERVVLPF
jgi:hypothetical protein